MRAGPKIRVGVVGLGFGCAVHLPAFRLDPRFEVLAVCGTRLEKARQIARDHSIPNAYDRWNDVISNPNIDVVSIAVPPALQGEIAEAAIRAGKHVFCEKPLSIRSETALRLDALARQSGLAHLVDFEFPEVSAWQVTRNLVVSRQIGEIRHVHLSWHVETYANRLGQNSWKTTCSEGGGTLLAFVSHCFYNVEWFLGPIVRLQAMCHRDGHDPGDADVLVHLNFVTASGVVGSIIVGSNSPAGSGHHWEFYGRDGAIFLRNSTSDYLDGFVVSMAKRQRPGEIPCLEVVPVPDETGPADGRIRGVAALVRRLADWVDSGLTAHPNISDGARVQVLIEAALRSNEMVNWIETREASSASP